MKLMLLFAASLACASCANGPRLTTEQCIRLNTVVVDAGVLANDLVAHGTNPNDARRIADATVATQVALAIACSHATPSAG